jgi:membrane protease YdiL (CAAX protease family)
LWRPLRVADQVRAILPLSIILGVIGTLVILALEFLFFQPVLLKELGETANALNLQTSQPEAWKGLLASFYDGIAEEVLLRLFMMSFLVWLGCFLSKTAQGKPTAAVFWTANILAAVLFGLGHLPLASGSVDIACDCTHLHFEWTAWDCVWLVILETRA